MRILPVCNNQYNNSVKSKPAKQNNNVNFKAELSSQLKHALLQELTPKQGPKILARIERQLRHVAKNINIQDITIKDGNASISARCGERVISYTEQVKTDSKIDVIRDLLKPNEHGISELDEL